MIRRAGSKLHSPSVEVICGDIETIPVHCRCDCCVVYNAFPHFEDPERLIKQLSQWIRPGGRLTVAHSMSLDALKKHHADKAGHVLRAMLSAPALAALMEPLLWTPWFRIPKSMPFQAKCDKHKLDRHNTRLFCRSQNQCGAGIPAPHWLCKSMLLDLIIEMERDFYPWSKYLLISFILPV